MKRPNIQFLTRTGMLLALTVVVQLVGIYIPDAIRNWIVGPLVNACLLVATALAGVWSGLFISLAAPYTSMLLNHASIASVLFFFGPFIVVGNAALVLLFHLFRNKGRIAGVLTGAVVKFGILYGGIVGFYALLEATGWITKIKGNKGLMLATFGYPQLLTALIGGVIAFAVIKLLDRQFKAH
jgi:hypothetical protein